MTLPPVIVEQVRQRAGAACEYCGVTEDASGGALTVDHYRPKSRGGADNLENLLYCCYRCNLYKSDYWPGTEKEPALCNPRETQMDHHWYTLASGLLDTLTPSDAFTIQRLRLNREPLVKYRRHVSAVQQEQHLLRLNKELLHSTESLQAQFLQLLTEHGRLLARQETLLRRLLRRDE